MAEPAFVVQGKPAAKLFQRVQVAGCILLKHKGRHGKTDHVPGFITEHSGHPRIDGNRVAIGANDPDAFVRGVDDAPVISLASPQCRKRPEIGFSFPLEV